MLRVFLLIILLISRKKSIIAVFKRFEIFKIYFEILKDNFYKLLDIVKRPF